MNETKEATGSQIRVRRGEDGALLLPSAFKDAEGKPRFELPIPPATLKDMAIKHLFEREAGFGGFEYPTRSFFDTHLEPGDLFIDVGAHWGIFALTAATRHPGEIQVLAIEAHPGNVTRLLAAVAHNRLQPAVEVVAAAAGHKHGTAPLMINTTMGHSIRGLGLKGLAKGDHHLAVPIITLDGLLAERPALATRRCLIKIDVEGFEPQVVAGAKRLLESGRVAALIWEKGRAFESEPSQTHMRQMIAYLTSLGFTQHRLPSHDLGGALMPFVASTGSYNVIALAPGFEPRAAYLRPAGPMPPTAPSNRGSDDPEARAVLTEALIAAKGSDATRWSDPQALGEGAEARAKLAGPNLAETASVIDLGAGSMRLKQQLAAGCVYRPVDLIPFAEETEVLDLNQDQFPSGVAEAVVALAIFEYLHDLPSLLARCAGAAPRLICSYPCRVESESPESRRRQGWFNDHTEAQVIELLGAAGWRIVQQENALDLTLFVCDRDPR